MTTMPPPSNADILLIDDGELDDVAKVLDAQGLAYERLRGGRIPEEVAAPRMLLIVTPRRVSRVRRSSPPGASPGRPLRIIAVQEDSPPMRRRLRQAGLQLLVRLPADPEIWRLLIARALYQGNERREHHRVAVGSPVAIGSKARPAAKSTNILVDLSNRGCRLQTHDEFSEGNAIAFSLPIDSDVGHEDAPLMLRGRVRRIAFEAGSGRRTLAVAFDADMPETTRSRLTGLINRWALSPDSMSPASEAILPTIPPCRMASLPELTLDDETDPPVPAHGEIRVRFNADDEDTERRSVPRGRYESPIVVEAEHGPIVLIGRDLSARGMRIERLDPLKLGDRFRIALHGPTRGEPFVVDAEIVRDDGDDGFGLVFDAVDSEMARELEKLVACLPEVESLDEGEIAGLGAILSEIMID